MAEYSAQSHHSCDYPCSSCSVFALELFQVLSIQPVSPLLEAPHHLENEHHQDSFQLCICLQTYQNTYSCLFLPGTENEGSYLMSEAKPTTFPSFTTSSFLHAFPQCSVCSNSFQLTSFSCPQFLPGRKVFLSSASRSPPSTASRSLSSPTSRLLRQMFSYCIQFS